MVKRTWLRPPRKDDILFGSVNGSQRNARDWEANAKIRGADDCPYAEGYHRAGRILADHVIQQGGTADLLVYPIAFLYRHSVELQFKRLIPIGAFLTDRVLSKENQAHLSKHDLGQLWAILEPILRQFGKPNGDVADED